MKSSIGRMSSKFGFVTSSGLKLATPPGTIKTSKSRGAVANVCVGTRVCQVVKTGSPAGGFEDGFVGTGSRVSAIMSRVTPGIWLLATFMISTGPVTSMS